MAVVRKVPFQRIECRTFAWRYNNWYKQELEAQTLKVEWPPIGYQYEFNFGDRL